MLIKTDHCDVILPACKKLRPTRHKVHVRDQREHRKCDLYLALAEEHLGDVYRATDVDEAVNQLEKIIHEQLDRFMPVRTLSMSSSDPGWMTPCVKCMLRTKLRISNSSEDRRKALHKRIAVVIFENGKNFLAGKGSCGWWKRVDNISQRCRSMVLSLDHASLEELNVYFGELCTDNTYTLKPEPLELGEDHVIPDTSERQAWNSLQQIRKTATGPDGIPYVVWEDHAELLAPVITMVWNLSLKSHTQPRSKTSNIIHLPKVDIPKEKTDYRGVNVIPVIARAFEKTVLSVHATDIMEEHLSASQFAYREGGSYTAALPQFSITVLKIGLECFDNRNRLMSQVVQLGEDPSRP